MRSVKRIDLRSHENMEMVFETFRARLDKHFDPIGRLSEIECTGSSKQAMRFETYYNKQMKNLLVLVCAGNR